MSQMPIECPKCEQFGYVGFDQVGHTLHCKKCGSSFYMNKSGQVRLGHAPPPGKEDRLTPGEMASALFEGVKEVVAANAVALVILLGLAGAAAAGALYYMRGAGVDTSRNRAMDVARLLVDNDAERLRDLSIKGTGDDAVAWLNRPRNALRLQGTSKNYAMSAEFYQGIPSKGSADFMLTLMPTLAPAPGASQDAIPPIIIHMAQEPGRDWQFDGARSLELAPKEPEPTGGRAGRASR